MTILTRLMPDLKTEKGQHYAAIISSFYAARLQELVGLGNAKEPEVESSPPSKAPAIDKPALSISMPRRLRSKEHLRYVAVNPCLVCGRTPSHAHHLRIAQPRALGRKVGDQWTVPLCALHHKALHERGNEAEWWQEKKIGPLTEAARLWQLSRPASAVDAQGQRTPVARPNAA